MSTGSTSYLIGILITLTTIVGVTAMNSSAEAHQSSFTYNRIELSEDLRVLTYEIKIHSTDLFEALNLDGDRDASSQEITDGADKLFAYLSNRVSVEIPGAGCRPLEPTLSISGARDRYAVVTLTYTCKQPIEQLALDYQLFFDLDARHVGLLWVDGESIQLSAPDHNRFEWTIGSPIEGGMGFIRSGIEHILFGLDHILFLLALLLMAVVTRSEKGWSLRPVRKGLSYTASIVTAFTVAHSITLISAALGWIDLPGRLVESVIAASIVFVAIENVVRPDPPHRYRVTFLFGLIHGLGFAAMLRPLLPPSDVVVSLLLFNVGVELGQITIVMVALPLLYLLASRVHANYYRSRVLPVGAAVLASMGGIWLIERAFNVTLLGL